MTIREIKIPVGATSPFKMLHTSDNHICLADERDDERKRELAAKRMAAFDAASEKGAVACCEEVLEYARAHSLPVLHTGDIMDFVSQANLDYVRKAFAGLDVFCAAGNHEYSLYVGEAFEDEAYKAQSFEMVKAAFPGNIWFQTRLINGVRFVAIDNGYYYITEEQMKLFREVAEQGEPIVLVVHNPLYSEDMYRQVMQGKAKDAPPYLFGCPEELLRILPEKRYIQQKPNALTLEFLDYCNHLPNLKAVVAGHLHAFYASRLDSGVPQYVCNGSYHDKDTLIYEFV